MIQMAFGARASIIHLFSTAALSEKVKVKGFR
jgi:hypothetical protein